MIIFLHFLIFQFSHQISAIFFTPIIGFEYSESTVFARNNLILFRFAHHFCVFVWPCCVLWESDFCLWSIFHTEYSHNFHSFGWLFSSITQKWTSKKRFCSMLHLNCKSHFQYAFFYSVCFLYLNTCTVFYFLCQHISSLQTTEFSYFSL